jgi:hypothetical protein
MSLWCKVLPGEPNRVLLMRTLARGTTIVGRMLDGIAAGSQLSAPAKWLTIVGRSLWGLVEISVPRHWATLLGRYWQSLLLLISIFLILAGLLIARPAISGFGWAVLAVAVFLLVARTILWDFMRAGSMGLALRNVAILIATGIFVVGLYQIYEWTGDGWAATQRAVCRAFYNCAATAQGAGK